jgi:hypothetical protein
LWLPHGVPQPVIEPPRVGAASVSDGHAHGRCLAHVADTLEVQIEVSAAIACRVLLMTLLRLQRVVACCCRQEQNPVVDKKQRPGAHTTINNNQ